MNIREFLRPEWKKFVLPFFFIAMLFLYIHLSQMKASSVFYYKCEILKIITESNFSNITSVNPDIVKRFDELNAALGKIYDTYEYEYLLLPPIAPVMINYPVVPTMCTYSEPSHCQTWIGPVKIEHICRDSDFCVSYIDKETFDCLKRYRHIPASAEYKELTYMHVIINVVILFIEWYMISCAALQIYRKKVKSALNRKITIRP